MAEKKAAPMQVLFENIPKVSIVTALTYMIIVFFNTASGGALAAYIDTATTFMLFGAILAVPAIIFDIAFTGTFEPGESLWVGFVNFFALLIEYALTNWDVFSQAALYAIYIYAALFIIALIVYIATYYAKVTKTS